MGIRSTALWTAILLMASASQAGEPSCCSGCGCPGGLKPVCRLVCEMKEVTEWVYDCKCEDFCVPGKSIKCDTCASGCASPHGHDHGCWQPTCGKVYNRTVLVKYPLKKQIPTYRCEVVYVCDRCCDHGANGAPVEQLPPLPQGAPLPPPPGAAPNLPQAMPPVPPPAGELRFEHPRR
jgi:hypothetical protein